MAATASETKERTIYTVKGTTGGAKVELTRPTAAALARAHNFCSALADAPGIQEEAKGAREALAILIERVLIKNS